MLNFIRLSLFLAISLTISMLYALDDPSPDQKKASQKSFQTFSKGFDSQEHWLDAANEQKIYSAFPATEVDLSVKFLKPGKTKRDQLIIENIDDEMLFCVRELLKQENVDFAYRKTKKSIDLVLFLKDNKKDRVLRLFNYYGLHYKK